MRFFHLKTAQNMISTIYKYKLIITYLYESKRNKYLFSIILYVFSFTSLRAEYPRSTSMLTKAKNKYYLKNTGEPYTGRVTNMSKKTWKKVLETYLVNGLINGEYKEWYPNGVLKYEGNFINGRREGMFYTWHPNGKIKNEMKYVNNALDSLSFSFLENGMMEKKHNQDTDLALVYDYSEFPKNLKTFSEQFGKLSGNYTKWDRFGRKIEEGYYYNNKKDSLWFKYDANGVVYERGRFRDNQKDGIWFNYDQYGRPSSKSYYYKGNLDSIKNVVYYMDGSEFAVKNYKLKSRENLIITFSQDGNKISKTQYIGSSLSGTSVKWFDNGQKEYQINFLNNRLNGIAEYWNFDGTKKKSGNFKNGNIIGDWTYYIDSEVKTD